MDLPDPGRIIDRVRLRLRNKKTKTARPYLVYLSDRLTEVVLSLITVRDIGNITTPTTLGYSLHYYTGVVLVFQILHYYD